MDSAETLQLEGRCKSLAAQAIKLERQLEAAHACAKSVYDTIKTDPAIQATESEVRIAYNAIHQLARTTEDQMSLDTCFRGQMVQLQIVLAGQQSILLKLNQAIQAEFKTEGDELLFEPTQETTV